MSFERTHILDALRFWEVWRAPFNLVMAAIVVVVAFLDIGADIRQAARWLEFLPAFFVFGVAANVLYCAAYPLDLLLQTSPLRESWRRMRWGLWALGLLFAIALTLLALFATVLAPTLAEKFLVN